MPIKQIKKQVDNAWTWTKRFFVTLCVWGIVFSLATVSQLRVGYEYDGAMVDSSAAFRRALAASPQPFTPTFWAVANQAYYLDKPKLIPYALAWMLKVCGFGVDVFALRSSSYGDGLRNDWRHLIPARDFIFLQDQDQLGQALDQGRYLLFFGSSDGAIAQAKKDHVFAVRILRRPQSGGHAPDYNPGMFHELRIPYSQY